MTQEEYLKGLRTEAEVIPEIVNSKYSGYSIKQLNWKPDSKSWSIGEVYEHIIQTNNLYYSKINKIIKDLPVVNAGELPVKHTFIGKLLIKAVSPGGRKVKTFKVFAPGTSNINNSIYQRFLEQHSYLINLIKESAKTDTNKIKISSPVSSLIKYNLGDVLGILVNHTKRHLEQIERTANLYNNRNM